MLELHNIITIVCLCFVLVMKYYVLLIIYFPVLMNAEPVNLGRDGADEPPTLIKEDLLTSGSVRQSTSDSQVHFMKTISQISIFFFMDIT